MTTQDDGFILIPDIISFANVFFLNRYLNNLLVQTDLLTLHTVKGACKVFLFFFSNIYGATNSRFKKEHNSQISSYICVELICNWPISEN